MLKKFNIASIFITYQVVGLFIAYKSVPTGDEYCGMSILNTEGTIKTLITFHENLLFIVSSFIALLISLILNANFDIGAVVSAYLIINIYLIQIYFIAQLLSSNIMKKIKIHFYLLFLIVISIMNSDLPSGSIFALSSTWPGGWMHLIPFFSFIYLATFSVKDSLRPNSISKTEKVFFYISIALCINMDIFSFIAGNIIILTRIIREYKNTKKLQNKFDFAIVVYSILYILVLIRLNRFGSRIQSIDPTIDKPFNTILDKLRDLPGKFITDYSWYFTNSSKINILIIVILVALLLNIRNRFEYDLEVIERLLLTLIIVYPIYIAFILAVEYFTYYAWWHNVSTFILHTFIFGLIVFYFTDKIQVKNFMVATVIGGILIVLIGLNVKAVIYPQLAAFVNRFDNREAYEIPRIANLADRNDKWVLECINKL